MFRGCGRVAALATLLTLFLPQSGGVYDWQGEARTAALDFETSRRLLTNLSTRIKDGETAPRGRYPYFVSLRTLGTFVHFCGGVLVEPDIVVTAAHCVDEQASTKSGVSEPIAVISPHGINDDEADGAEVISTVKTVVHENWQSGQFLEGYDIAVLFLKRPSTHQPIQLAPSDVPSFGQKLTATGFGGMAGDKFSQTLRQASSLDFVPNKNCNRPDVYEGKIKDSMICALDLITGQDTCQGDSGGPLAIADKNGKAEFDRLVGIVSFGPKPCGTGNMPGVYTRVSSFADWIQEVKRNRDNPAPRPRPVASPEAVPAPSNPVQQGSNPPSEPSPAYTGDKEKLAQEYQCPVGVPCENDKTIAVNGVETICKCFAWMTDGFCHPQGWELMEGPGDCNFVADK